MVAQTRGSGSAITASPKKLQFKDKLVGKGYSTDVLLKKLQALHQELAEMDQERVDTKSMETVKKELIQTPILLHKDKGVKAHAACCLADILRLYAPDAPYTADELRDIFQFFFRQLSIGLKGSDSPYYNQYFLLLESLSTVKSVVLVCDLHHADELMADIFRDLFTVVRNDLAKNVEICIVDILVALVDESQSVPHPVLDSIMAQFLDKNARMDQPAYRLAVEVCNATADKLQRYVCQYFNEIIVQHSKDDDFAEIRTAHDLIKQINRDCPSLLHNVVPQLQEELKASEYEVRLLATQVLGQMFSEKGGGDLKRKYPHVWDVWQARKNDKAPGVRIAFVEACQGIIVLHAELREKVEVALKAKLFDPDDKVRAATCKLYSQFDYETALHHVSLEQLQVVGGRCLDKKRAVRSEAMLTIGKLFSLARPEIENNDPAAIAQFAWIPEAILHSVINTETRAMVDSILQQFVFPLPPKGEDEVAWTDQLLTVMKYLDEHAAGMLLNVAGLKQLRPTIFERFVTCCEENNGGVIDKNEEQITRRLNMVIQHIAVSFPDRAKAAEDLHAFAKLNEGRLYKLLKTCMDTQTDLKTLVKATNEFLRRLEQSSSSIVDTMATIHRKASLWVINTSSVPSLLKRVQRALIVEDDSGSPSETEVFARLAKDALTFVSKHCPSIYKPHVGELAKALADEKNPRLGEVALQALAAARWDGIDKRTQDRVVKYAQTANVRHAKFAGRLIGQLKDREKLALQVINAITEALPNIDEELLVGHLATLSELVKATPDAFEQRSDVIVGFLVNQILMRTSPADDDAMDGNDGDEWAPEADVSWLTKAKILSIKICRNRCLAHGGSDSALNVATPVLKLLFTLLAYGGSMNEDARDDPRVKSRIRLQAATSLVQLAAVPACCDEILPNFSLLAVTVQDPCFQVRMGFLSKLITFLTRSKIDARFNTIIFLTAHDPEREVREKARSYVKHTLTRISSEARLSFDMIFLRLLHLLAHHPDFALETQNLHDTAKYIEFYLDLISNTHNIPLLYHLAMKGKTVRDALPEFSENLYCVSELAQEIIKNRAKLNAWQLTSYPGKVKLPSDIFKGLTNAEVANKIMKTVYLPKETTAWLSELGKTARSPNAKGKSRPAGEAKAGRKRKSPTKPRATATTKKPQRKKRKKDFEDEDDEEDSDDSDAESPVSDNEVASKSDSNSEDEDAANGGEDGLGRGARGRAKKRARKEAKKQKRERNGK